MWTKIIKIHQLFHIFVWIIYFLTIMNIPQNIRIKEYNYPLPDERIAKFPLPERDRSKLLVYDRGDIDERRFTDLPGLLPEGSLLVMNNTRVIQARLFFYKETGARVEILVLEPLAPREYQENFARRGQTMWHCMVGGLKKWKQGPLTATVRIDGRDILVIAEKGLSPQSSEQTRTASEGANAGIPVSFMWDERYTWSEVLEAMGELPIPPYLNRKTEESDKQTYQTVYSKIEGSVAAPTAGLHFTEQVLKEIDRRGIEREEVTLHVGAGTFRPVKSEDIGHHDMHTEHIAVQRRTIEKLIKHGGHAIAVGTTSVRTLESLYWMGKRLLAGAASDTSGKGETLHVSQWEPYDAVSREEGTETLSALQALLDYMDGHSLDVLHASTQIIIAPGYEYRIVERIITNFHQPQSTLLLLVSAFVGDDWKRIYRYALEHDFRFLSYGDSSLLVPRKPITPTGDNKNS